MKIKSIKKTDSKHYPLTVTMDTERVIKIPQQKSFGAFSKKHGCSLAAVDIALQMSGINKTPDEIHKWAKTHIGENYTGSKLTIYGAYKAINGMGGNASWYPITAKGRGDAVEKIREALKDGAIVLLEMRLPIHTNALVAFDDGKVKIATNGKIKTSTVKKLVNGALTGYSQKEKQRFWYKGGQSSRAAGFVVVKGK